MRQIFWIPCHEPTEEYIVEMSKIVTFDGISPTHGGSQTTTIYYRDNIFFRITTDAFNSKWWIGNIT